MITDTSKNPPKSNTFGAQQKVYAALWCQAICDAVGNPFEFQDNPDPEKVIDHLYDNHLVISDDTQMTMFGFQAMHFLLDGTKPLTKTDFERVFTEQYLAWHITQTNTKYAYDNYAYCFSLPNTSSLLEFQSMFSIQSPGMTCLDALYRLRNHSPLKNDSKGCGSVMRLLPLLLLYKNGRYPLKRTEIIEYAIISAGITHHHPENAVATKLYIETAMDLMDGLPIREMHPNVEDISVIGEGWTALEAVEMAIWAVGKTNSFEELLTLTICHGGDSDSVAAIAGSLWGLTGKYWPGVTDRLDVEDALIYICGE